MEVLRGGGELVGGILSSFWWLEGCWEAFWEMEAMRLDIGDFEAGKWEARGWKMWAQNKRTGGLRGGWRWFDGKQPLGGVELRIVSLTFRPLGLTACSARLGVLAVLPEQRVH